MSVTLSKTSKNAPLLIFNDYSYTIDRKSETKILWKCEYSRKYACHGRLHTKLNYEFIKTVGEHENHTGNPRCETTRKYYERLRQKSEQNQTSSHNILTQTTIGVPDEVRVQLPKNTTGPTPTSIDFPVIPPKYHQTTLNTTFFQKDTGPGSQRLLVFFTNEQKITMENATEFFIDGTFKVVPEIFFQLFAIHATYCDHVIPVAFILLSSKTEQIYQQMVNEIIQLAPARQPQRVMMDFEKATINVFNHIFPAVELSGCYFHFCQNVLRFLQTHGFKQKYETDVIFADNMHKICALTFMEPTMVIDGFELLCSNLDTDYHQVLDYIEDNYIGRLRRRTRRQPSYPIDFWNMVTRV
ncbi:unnamed protein product [Rotaria sordida]|uniref:MULE transposase domain-containing protein n=2 Tax=Rotaria sordida TaxID=392033 RepID=A0A815KIZ7_9BILA|nr:unnamed protein product [Rotaria sordida]CAF4056704.1 unnamed protein product [Rotaria sordida]